MFVLSSKSIISSDSSLEFWSFTLSVLARPDCQMLSPNSVTTAMTLLLLLKHFSACLSLVQSIISSDSSMEVWSFTLSVLARPDCQMLLSNRVIMAMMSLLLLEYISAHLFLVQSIIISSDSSMEI